MNSVISNTIYVFIDASNLWQAQKARGRFFDYANLIKYIRDYYRGSSISVYYYTAYPANGTRTYSLDGKHKFYTFLKKCLGFVVRKKKLIRIVTNVNGKEVVLEKGNMDVEMTIDAVYLSHNFNTAVLFSGDSDFLALVHHLKNCGKKVYIFSSKNNVSQELRTGADGYIDVLKVKNNIWGRDLKLRDKRHGNENSPPSGGLF